MVPRFGNSVMFGARPVAPVSGPESQTIRRASAASRREPRLQAADDVEADRLFSASMNLAELTEQRQWRPKVGCPYGQSTKSLRHHADDLVRSPIDQQAPAENRRVLREHPVPPFVAQDHHRISRKSSVVGRRQGAAKDGVDTDHLEEISGDERARHHAPVDAGVDVLELRVGIDKHAGFGAQRLELRPREARTLAVGIVRPLDDEHLVHIGHGVDAEQEHVEDGEDDGDQAKPQRHRRNDRERDQRRPLDRAERIQHVANRVVDERGAALVAAFVRGQRHRTEPLQRRRPRIGRAHALGDQLLRFALDVERELLVELALGAPWHHESAGAQHQVAEIHRGIPGYASFMMRPMAADICSHSRASTASWRRPGAVSW